MADNNKVDGSMEAQLIALYAQRERLAQELGTADPAAIVKMVRSLEEQLEDLYKKGADDGAEPPVSRKKQP